jgi:tetratricopeptide (TPR) repeat protein
MSRSGNILFTPASQSMPAKPFQYDVFLSHNRAQKDWTRDLDARLRQAGFNVWFDERNIRAGEVGSIAMERGVEESRHILLALSPEFIASEWTDFETQIAIVLSPANRDRKIIPILHTKCKLPPRLSRISWIDFSDTHGNPMQYEFHLAQLMSDLNPGRFDRPADFKTFQASRQNPNSIPSVHPLPAGSRMPQASNPLFVGREEEMRTLKQSLTPGSNALVGVHAAVVGMGGVGKTQLAIEYAHRFGHDYLGGVFWLNFAGEEDPINEVARCGGPEGMDLEKWSEMKAPEQASRVHKHWEENEHASLLIFDNAEDPAAVEKWRPKHGHSSILITCRRDDWPPEMGVKPLAIETLPRQKSLELLAEVRHVINKDPKERDAADQICDRLGDLPLALTVAAFYLRKYKSDSLAEYLKALSSQPAIQDPSLEKVSLSFGVSYNKLKPENATDALAQKLFHLASWFAPVSINRELLIGSADVDVSDRTARHSADDAVARLRDLGLIKEEPDGRLLLHRLLRDFAQMKPSTGLDKEKALMAVGGVLYDFANKENQSGLPQALARERSHLREVAAVTEPTNAQLVARLYNELGINGRMIALLQESKTDYEHALKIAEELYGLQHTRIANYVNNLGMVLRDLGDLASAHANFERALKIDEAIYGPDHPNVASDVNNLGSVLQDLRDLPGARANSERALRICEATYGPDHPKVATILNNLASVLYDLDDLAGARTNFERALKIGEATYGPDHPNVASTINNLGLVLQHLGDLAGACTNLERALKISESIYGSDHPVVAIRVSNLGAVLLDLGDLAGARANFERAITILKKALGEDHPNTKLVKGHLNSLTEIENEQKNTG